MRRLLFIPILHTEADLGSLGPEVTRRSIAVCGEERWAQHQQIVRQFWQRIADCMLSLDPAALRLYQDGLAAEGAAGLGIIEEAARRGSPNYRLLLELVRRGAVLRKTEDPDFLMGERQNLLSALGVGQPGRGGQGQHPRPADHRGVGHRLLEARDRFIAGSINRTLKEGETGVLFLGAHHNLRSYLAADIAVLEVKEPGKVRAYFEALFSSQAGWHSLADYLTSPILLPTDRLPPS